MRYPSMRSTRLIAAGILSEETRLVTNGSPLAFFSFLTFGRVGQGASFATGANVFAHSANWQGLPYTSAAASVHRYRASIFSNSGKGVFAARGSGPVM